MSTPLASSIATPPAERPARKPLPGWLREPLLHFVLLGGLLFALDHELRLNVDDPHAIVVSAAVDQDLRQTFSGARGTAPDARQLAALRQAWLDNEVLYREGIAMRVDQGDVTIRERVIFKALNIVEAGLKPPKEDEKTLRAWFEAHRDKYDEPPRYDFQEALLPGENTEAGVRAFVGELNTGTGSTRAGLRVFKGRPLANLVQGYGAEAAKQIAEAQPGPEWRAVQTRDGWRAMRVEAATGAKPATFEAVANAVHQDWLDATMAEQRTTAVRALGGKYKVRFEGDKP